MRDDRDIVDAIDELVDWQMSNYENRSGYDRNVNQVTCPHAWCDADWHGLAITVRMRMMRRVGYIDPDYRYADDDSEVVCPGSDFDGEFTPPVDPRAGIDTRWGTLADTVRRVAAWHSEILGTWPLPDDPHDQNTWLADTPRWWRCDNTAGLHVRLEDQLRSEFEDLRSPDRVTLWNNQWRLHVNGEPIELRPDPQTRNVCRHGTNAGRQWLEIHTSTPPRAGGWRPVSGILDMDAVDALRPMQLVMTLPFGTSANTNMLQTEMLQRFTHEASQRWPGFCMDLTELTVETAPDHVLRLTRVIGTWRPNALGGVLDGGHAHGRQVDANAGHRVETVAPVTFTPADFDCPPPMELNTVTYERAAYDTVTRRWVYRPRRPAPRATVHVRREGEAGWQEIGTLAEPVQIQPAPEFDAPALRFTPAARSFTATFDLADAHPDLVRLLQGDDNPADEPAEGDQAA